ncbi:HelD family protein [Tenggerimyces flavus]|uniref:HelD family protein n=1 Tax=Tenggerimyces flavus TaxID=1708749 RepID=A0ABV7Y6Y8_9ACTN|nr:AAA family ATPase [Tenggerimyces flavus]MBM7788423.1 DNA helicase IV [Tenggerimyces flavus]
MEEDPALAIERAYLLQARAALRRMHSEVVNLDTPLIGGEDNDERFTNEAYQRDRWIRAQALVDLPDVPLFFGRLDYEHGTVEESDRLYIGRRHVIDDRGMPLVIDWRARVSVPFYRATRTDRQHVLLRRRYGYSDAAELTGFEDEPLTDGSVPADGEAYLRAEIERPRTGPMRDIVATIQPEQDDLVRAPLHPSICVQGAPGTGKTAIGLHRIAYLLYTERERLGRGDGVVIVGPNKSFLSYIRKVLPALGEVNVKQSTIDEVIAPYRVLHPESGPAPRVKGDARMAAVLRRAVWLNVGTPSEGILYAKGSMRYRVHADQVIDIVAALHQSATRYEPARAALPQRLAHAVLVKMEERGEITDDRTQNAAARSKPVKDVVTAVWPKLTPELVLHRLLSDASFLASAADGVLSAEEQTDLLWAKAPRSVKSVKWTEADSVLLDELADLLEHQPTALGHLVVDEAQDLSAMQLRALSRRCRNGSVTVLGDLAQATTPWAPLSWADVLGHLGIADATLVELDRGFRVPAQIIDFASRLLPTIAPTLARTRSVRSMPDALQVVATGSDDFAARLASACRSALAGEGSVALIAADEDIASFRKALLASGLESAMLGETEDAMESARLVCVPARLAKGLEFDGVVVAEPAHIVAAEPRGLHRLYVVLTRAVSTLHVVHSTPLPEALAS